jgi:hypothetical protein
VLRLQVIAKVVDSSPILVTVMMKAINSSEISVLTRATRRNIPEYGFFRSHMSFYGATGKILKGNLQNKSIRRLESTQLTV